MLLCSTEGSKHLVVFYLVYIALFVYRLEYDYMYMHGKY